MPAMKDSFCINEPLSHKLVTSSTNYTKLENESRENKLPFNSEDHDKHIVDFKGETITSTQILVKVYMSKDV